MFKRETPINIKSFGCSCAAGQGLFHHVIGLAYTLAHYQMLGMKSVPPVISKTSKPQVQIRHDIQNMLACFLTYAHCVATSFVRKSPKYFIFGETRRTDSTYFFFESIPMLLGVVTLDRLEMET